MKQFFKDIAYFIYILVKWEGKNSVAPSDPHKLKIYNSALKTMNVIAVIWIVVMVAGLALLIIESVTQYNRDKKYQKEINSLQEQQENQNQYNVSSQVNNASKFEPEKSSTTLVSSFAVTARIYHYIVGAGDGYGIEKPTDKYVDLIVNVMSDGNVYCNGMPVRFSVTNGYDYECNNGNIIYKFNSDNLE